MLYNRRSVFSRATSLKPLSIDWADCDIYFGISDAGESVKELAKRRAVLALQRGTICVVTALRHVADLAAHPASGPMSPIYRILKPFQA